MSCFNITSLQLSDTFNTWFQRTNEIIGEINSIQIAGISVYDHPTNHYFGQKIERINGSCYLTSEIITGPFINFQTGNPSHYGSGTSADPWKITLTFPNDSAFLADRQMTGNDELIINDSVSTGIPVKRIKAKDIVPSTIDVSYLRIQNRDSQAQGSTFAFYTDSEWSGISASSFSAERLQGYVPSTAKVNKRVIPLTDNVTGLIPDDFVRMPMIFRVGSQLVSGFDATADVKSFNISVSSRSSTAPGGEGGLLIQATTGTDGNSSVPNAVSYNIEALIPATGNSGPYGVNLFNINGYSVLHSAMSADSRSRLSAHMGLSGGKGISTNLVARGITVNYIIPGDPNSFIQYSGMTAVDIFTIAENPLDSNYVRKIGDTMTGTLTGSSTNFVFGNGEILNTLTADNITNTTLFTGKNLKTTLGYAQFSLNPLGGTFTVNNNNTPANHILQIVPTNSVSLNNGDHVFTDDNISLDKDGTGVVQIGYAGPQSGKSFFVNGDSQFDGNMQVYEGLVVDGGITSLNGNVNVDGNLDVSGDSSTVNLVVSSQATIDKFTSNTGHVGSLTGEKISIDNTLDQRATLEVALGKTDYTDDSWVLLAGSITNDSNIFDNTFGIASENNSTHKSAVVSKGNMWIGYPNYRDAELRVHGQINVTGQSPSVNVQGELSAQSVTAGTVYSTKFRGMDFIPIGTILPYGGNPEFVSQIPNNSSEQGNGTYIWLICNGGLYPTADYPELFSVLGNAYGGNGQSSFAIPDLRGRFPMGANTSANPNQILSSRQVGQLGGSEDKLIEVSNLPPHKHNFAYTFSIIPNGESDNNPQAGRSYVSRLTEAAIYDKDNNEVVDENGSNQTKFATMNPFTVVSYLIRAKTY